MINHIKLQNFNDDSTLQSALGLSQNEKPILLQVQNQAYLFASFGKKIAIIPLDGARAFPRTFFEKVSRLTGCLVINGEPPSYRTATLFGTTPPPKPAPVSLEGALKQIQLILKGKVPNGHLTTYSADNSKLIVPILNK